MSAPRRADNSHWTGRIVQHRPATSLMPLRPPRPQQPTTSIGALAATVSSARRGMPPATGRSTGTSGRSFSSAVISWSKAPLNLVRAAEHAGRHGLQSIPLARTGKVDAPNLTEPGVMEEGCRPAAHLGSEPGVVPGAVRRPTAGSSQRDTRPRRPICSRGPLRSGRGRLARKDQREYFLVNLRGVRHEPDTA